MMIFFCFILFANLFLQIQSFKLNPKYSVSGVSAGAYMAGQFGFAFSAEVDGFASFASGPYFCTMEGGVTVATTVCMISPYLLSMTLLDAAVSELETSQLIDPLENLRNNRYYIYAGEADVVVNPHLSGLLQEQLQHFRVSSANITTNYNTFAGHGVPTLHWGVDCELSETPFINKCNVDGVYQALKAIYPTIKEPSVPIKNATFVTLITDHYMPVGWSASQASLGSEAFAYVPQRCQTGAIECKLHIALHGCDQDINLIGPVFLLHTNYVEMAESNDMVILFPQTTTSFVVPFNPQACFDWWGYTNSHFASKASIQMNAIRNMAIALGVPLRQPLDGMQPSSTLQQQTSFTTKSFH